MPASLPLSKDRYPEPQIVVSCASAASLTTIPPEKPIITPAAQTAGRPHSPADIGANDRCDQFFPRLRVALRLRSLAAFLWSRPLLSRPARTAERDGDCADWKQSSWPMSCRFAPVRFLPNGLAILGPETLAAPCHRLTRRCPLRVLPRQREGMPLSPGWTCAKKRKCLAGSSRLTASGRLWCAYSIVKWSKSLVPRSHQLSRNRCPTFSTPGPL